MSLGTHSWLAALNIAIGGGAVLALQALGRALITDVATRISASMWGIRAFDTVTGWALRHPVWSGTWEITWKVRSTNFHPVNTETGQLYRCFNTVALEGSGTTAAGHKIPYGFVGRLSRDKSILTGTWFDRRGDKVGYHGVFQLRVQGASGTAAFGRWAGFSEMKPVVNADVMEWTRISD